MPFIISLIICLLLNDPRLSEMKINLVYVETSDGSQFGLVGVDADEDIAQISLPRE